jgi:hypothetical protein
MHLPQGHTCLRVKELLNFSRKWENFSKEQSTDGE